MTSFPVEVFAPEQLTVNSVETIGPMMMWLDLANLWIPTSEWENRIAGGVAGSQAQAGIQTELRTTLIMWVQGGVDWEGTPYADRQTGFRRNWRYLSNNLFLPSGDKYYEAVYQSPDATEDPITFPMQIVAPRINDRKTTMWQGTVDVCLPLGAL